MLTVGCTETEIQFVDREPFNPPPDAAAGFLGYYTPSDKQTTCGNCHIGVQTVWAASAHADAWATLEGSGHAQAFCNGCHTVSELGNAVDSAAGYNRVADSAYHDVQCESCHGPGLVHIQEPGATQPYASIAIDSILDAATNGCGECHTGTHHPFVEQWAASKHGFAGHAYLAEGGRPECAGCHEGRAAILEKFNETGHYVEKSDATNYQPILCATCHDPHGSPYDGQLRASASIPSRDNLCVSCHSRKAAPSGTMTRGAHAAQGLLVIGEDAGWIPPNFTYDTNRIVSSHGTLGNPRLCATCHVPKFDVTDAATGEFLLTSVGHTFEAIQCLDAQGLPTAGPCTDAQRDFRSCATAGCHTSELGARGAFQAARSRMEFLTDQLWLDVNGNGTIDPHPTDTGLLARIVANNDTAALNPSDQTTTVAEGALWNAQLAATHNRAFLLGGRVFGRNFSAHKASGEGTHNPFLLEALLTASISAVQQTYMLPSPPAEAMATQLTEPPGWRRVR
jgi:predicted CXXCH cytochrome family protein